MDDLATLMAEVATELAAERGEKATVEAIVHKALETVDDASDAGSFADRESVDHALLRAVHAAHALASARLLSVLEVAMSSRHLIGVAQGILVERHGLSVDQSSDLECRISSATDVEVADLDRQVVETGAVPDLDRS